MTAVKVAVVSAALFLSLFTLTHHSVIGTEIIPCGGSLNVYCWTADVLGNGLAWVAWHAAFSLAIGWAIVVLPQWDAERHS